MKNKITYLNTVERKADTKENTSLHYEDKFQMNTTGTHKTQTVRIDKMNQDDQEALFLLGRILFSGDKRSHENVYDLALRVSGSIEHFRKYDGFCTYIETIIKQGSPLAERQYDEFTQRVA